MGTRAHSKARSHRRRAANHHRCHRKESAPRGAATPSCGGLFTRKENIEVNNPNHSLPTKQGQLSKNEHAARLIKQKYILELLTDIHKDETAMLARKYDAGDKAEIKNDNGVKIGTVSMSNPTKKAVEDDEAVLLGYAMEHGYDVEDALPANGTREALQIIDLVYAAGKEDLLIPSVSEEHAATIRDQVLRDWEFTGGKDLPLGWNIKDASSPRFSVRKGSSAQAKAAFEREMEPIREVLEQSAFREIEKGA